MKTIGLRELYDTHGFVIVPQVLSGDETRLLRAHLDRRYAALGNPLMLFPSVTLRDPVIYEPIFRDSVMRALAELFGTDYTSFLDFSVVRNGFGRPGEVHSDCDAEGAQRYLMAPNYRFAKCGIYLQENLPEWGGGVTVVPGAHRFPLRTGIPAVDFRLKRLRDRLILRRRERWASLKAGDLLVFDSRLPHQSAFPSRFDPSQIGADTTLPLPPEHTKYVLYWNACSSEDYVSNFVEHTLRRAERGEAFFVDYLRLRYPEDLGSDLVDRVKSAGIRVAGPSPDRIAEMAQSAARLGLAPV